MNVDATANHQKQANRATPPNRLLMLTPGWPPARYPNGIVTYTFQATRMLRSAGVDARVMSLGGCYNEIADIPLVELHKERFDRIRSAVRSRLGRTQPLMETLARRVASSVRRARSAFVPELIETEETMGLPGHLAARLNMPIIARLHGPWFLNGRAVGAKEDDQFERRNQDERSGVLAAHGVSAPSEDVLRRARSAWGIDLPDAQVIPLPIEPLPADMHWSAQTAEPNHVVFIGRFDLHKGGDLIIRAFARLLHAIPTARLTFIGPDRGIPNPSGGKTSLDSFIHEHIPDAAHRAQVNVLGQQPAPVVTEWRKRAALVVAPSRYETFCIAVAEAMSMGCPIVAANAGAIPELIQDGHNGLLARPDDPIDLAAQLTRLLTDSDEANRLGTQARVDCESRYNPDVIARRTLEYYAQVISSYRTNSGTGSSKR